MLHEGRARRLFIGFAGFRQALQFLWCGLSRPLRGPVPRKRQLASMQQRLPVLAAAQHAEGPQELVVRRPFSQYQRYADREDREVRPLGGKEGPDGGPQHCEHDRIPLPTPSRQPAQGF